jgi:hypothetical protein
MLRSSGTEVQHSTHNPKMKGSNPALAPKKMKWHLKKLQVLNNSIHSKNVPILTKPIEGNVFEEG